MTDHYVRDDVRGFLAFLNAIEGPEMRDMALAEARGAYVAMVPVAESEPRELAVVRDLTCPGLAGEIPLRLYDARASREPGPAVVFYHGGGFTIGDLETHHALCTEIAAEMDLPVIAVHYRLAPEHPFPAAPDDCEAATRWVAGSPGELGFKVTGLIPIGDSAGGNLTIVTAQALKKNPAAAPVIMQVPIYPATAEDGGPSMTHFGEGFLLTQSTMEWFMASYAGEAGNHRAFPILGDLTGTPPTVLVTAGLDPLRDQGRAYGAALIEAGVELAYLEMRGNIHGFTTIRKAVPSAHADLLSIFAAMRLMLTRVSA